MTGVGDSNTGTFEECMVARDAKDRKGVEGGDKEESSLQDIALSSGERG